MAYTDYKTGGRHCKLYVCDLGTLSALPGVEADFTEIKFVKTVDVTGAAEEAEAGDRQGGGFKGFAMGDRDFRMEVEMNCVASDPGYQMLIDCYNDLVPIGVVSCVGDPNAIGSRLDYMEAYVTDVPANQAQNEVVSGSATFVRAAGTIVPTYAHVTTGANELFTTA